MSNIAGIYYNDTAAAPGICVSVYLSGCPIRCKGCHNPQAQDKHYGVPLTDELLQNIVSSICLNNVYRKLCILGGEPLSEYNIEATYKIISECRKTYPELEVYIWTGYTFEQLKQFYNIYNSQEDILYKVLISTDFIIDGPFIKEKRDTTLMMRGSSNQRIINVAETLKIGEVIEQCEL